MRVNNINVNNGYFSFRAENKNKNQTKMQPVFRNETESSDSISRLTKKENIKNSRITAQPLSPYAKILFKRFQNFNAENVIDLNTGIEVTAESINEETLRPGDKAFMQIAKTPFFTIIDRIAENEEEEEALTEKLHSLISEDFNNPSNPVEEAFSQYISVVPHITQENSFGFVLPMFEDLKKLDSETVTDRDILKVIKSHVKRQKEEQPAYEIPLLGKIYRFVLSFLD